MAIERNEIKVIFNNEADRVATKRKCLALFEEVQFTLEDGRRITARIHSVTGQSEEDAFHLYINEPKGSFPYALITFPNGDYAKTRDIIFSYDK